MVLCAWLITDERGRNTYQLGDVRTNDADYHYDWSTDNQKELDLGILRRANSIEDLARATNLGVEALSATIARWNAQCDAGEDADFGRPPGTMSFSCDRNAGRPFNRC